MRASRGSDGACRTTAERRLARRFGGNDDEKAGSVVGAGLEERLLERPAEPDARAGLR
jgi:hypothetical protein